MAAQLNFRQNPNLKEYSFNSIGEFLAYIEKTPFNPVFINPNDRDSVNHKYGFTKTANFDEAVSLLKNGWTSESEVLEKKLKDVDFQKERKTRQNFDVVGYQASVPRYLQGVPQNMFNKKTTIQKQKIVNVYKNISYSASISKDQIERESIKALNYVRTLEAQGQRVNLFIVLGSATSKQGVIVKIKIKNSSERLNISKMSFPLVHPSMLRRFLLRFIEIMPHLGPKDTDIRNGYGRPAESEDIKLFLNDSDILLPAFMPD